MDIDKYYYEYQKGEIIKKIVEKYSTTANKYELLKEVNKAFLISKLFNENAIKVVRDFIIHEITSKALLILSNANLFIDEILSVIYSIKIDKSSKSAKVIKSKDSENKGYTVLKYKDYTVSISDCNYNEWSSITSDISIISHMMSNNLIFSFIPRFGFYIPEELMNQITNLIKKYKLKNIYELSRGFYLSAYKQLNTFKIPLKTHTIDPILDKDFGATGNLFSKNFEDDSIVIIDSLMPRLVNYYLLDKIIHPVLKKGSNIIFILISHTRLQGEASYNIEDFPMITEIFQSPHVYNSDCILYKITGVTVDVRFISNNDITHINNNNKQ